MTVQSEALGVGSILDSAPWSARVFDGEWVSSGGGCIDVIEPATGQVLTHVGVANATDVATAAGKAARAQPDWVRVAAPERSEVFLRAAAYLQRHREELAGFIARETGGTRANGQREVDEAGVQLSAAAGIVLPAEGVALPSTPGRMSIARRVPLGVIGILSPCDFPLFATMRSAAPALAAGNAVVLVPDAQTAVTGGFIVALAFRAAGLPAGLLQVLPGGADAGEAVCTDPNVKMIVFTGSTATGRRVGELAGKHLKKVSLRLAGKSALIVLEDADLDLAVRNLAWRACLHRGEVCMATGRVLVHEKVAAALIERVAARARHGALGVPAASNVVLGPLLTERQRDRVHAIVAQAVAAGAKLEAGGSFEGLIYAPTVLSAVLPGMRAFREEIFGPVAAITTFASDEEAIALANDAEPGLSAAVISRSIERAMAIADHLHAQFVDVNAPALEDESTHVWCATASVHRPRGSGPADVSDYTEWRWVTLEDSAPPYPF